MGGRLVLCSTPIGNLGDASPRLATVLGEADVVLAEDTRRSRKLLDALGVDARLLSFFSGNESERLSELGERLSRGEVVALITDAGTPSVSDPGRRAVDVARAAGAEVVVVPGPSAVTAAVAVSGMVSGPFVFEGFLARRGAERATQLASLEGERRPSVMFLSPHRLGPDLEALAAALGPDRMVCVARELTKVHEEVWWGTLGEAVTEWGGRPARGEFTVVLAGAEPQPVASLAEAVESARRYRAEGMSASQASRRAAAETGVERRAIFDALVTPEAPIGD